MSNKKHLDLCDRVHYIGETLLDAWRCARYTRVSTILDTLTPVWTAYIVPTVVKCMTEDEKIDFFDYLWCRLDF